MEDARGIPDREQKQLICICYSLAAGARRADGGPDPPPPPPLLPENIRLLSEAGSDGAGLLGRRQEKKLK